MNGTLDHMIAVMRWVLNISKPKCKKKRKDQEKGRQEGNRAQTEANGQFDLYKVLQRREMRKAERRFKVALRQHGKGQLETEQAREEFEKQRKEYRRKQIMQDTKNARQDYHMMTN